MAEIKAKNNTPENIRRIVDIVVAIVGRISHNTLEKKGIPCLCMEKQKGMAI